MTETKVLLYTRNKDVVAERLHNLISALVPEKNIEISRSIKRLSQSLGYSSTYNTLAVLLASSEENLQELLAINDFLVNFRIILILPDDEKEMMAKGYRLYPRFVSNITSDFKDVGAVMKKILKNI